MTRKLTILFIPLDGYGHINACVGVAERLHEHGHRTIFALERAWTGKASRYAGVEEVLFVDQTRDDSLGANDYWISFMAEYSKEFRRSPLEAIREKNLKLEKDFLYALINVDEELRKIIDDVQPDVIVVDTYVTIPAVYKSGIPWVWLTSAGPLIALPDENLPPTRSGYPTNGDRAQWKKFIELKQTVYKTLGEEFLERLKQFDMPPTAPGSVMHPSPYLNMYAYPEELDYLNIRPLPEKWTRFDHFIRKSESDEHFEIPSDFLNDTLGKLVYVSMGSMGCADEELMLRLISIASQSPNRFIFSLGPLEEKLRPHFTPNIWGAKFVPQTKILPLVDLVITHGGNNTFIESFYFGKPVLVTPLFSDQLDNAQRATELGLGQRISPFDCTEEEFCDSIEQLLSNVELSDKLRIISKRMQNSNSTEKAALAIEKLVQ